MDYYNLIYSINSIQKYSDILKKITINPQLLTEDEKVYILTCAIILIKKYEKDNRYTSFLELAYYIILKYSLYFNDYEPLYDFSVNLGYYPIAQAITLNHLIEFDNISFSLLSIQINKNFKRKNIIETLEQKLTHDKILTSKDNEISFIAPTSFGKSSIIIDHIIENLKTAKRIAIIVPTKSLLMQTYRLVREKLNIKILIHEEMYNNEEKFIGIFTQERALRLLDKKNIYFDILYIDEAHKLFECDSRSILLLRLIKLNKQRNIQAKIIYLSPLITNTESLKFSNNQNIFEQRIKFNIKEPEIYEYRTTKISYKYNRFLDKFFELAHYENMFDYLEQNKTKKTFCYLYAPRKIELFAKKLAEKSKLLPMSNQLKEVIENLKKYVHKDFYVVEYLQKGIIYLHGKMPDHVKDYLEYKFSNLSEIQFIIANKVILEGINLPVDSLFIFNGTKLDGKELTNLIGRVNRLDQIFKAGNNLYKLMPSIHFVNSDEYNRTNGKLENKIKLLKKSIFPDKIQNPLLKNFNILEKNKTIREKYEIIRINESIFFDTPSNSIQKLKQKMIALGMSSIYHISDTLCTNILEKMKEIQNNPTKKNDHFLKKLQYVFVTNCYHDIIDEEFKRLQNNQAIIYYNNFFTNRKKSLKDNILSTVIYFEKKIKNKDNYLFIGKSYGEISFNQNKIHSNHNVYVDLSKKTKQELVNIAIIKLKIEDDFVNYKLHMFFQLMYDYNLLNIDEYNEIIYGTKDNKKLNLIKMGLTINIINRLEDDNQLENLKIDKNGNIIPNEKFITYANKVDDFYHFELNKFLQL